MASRDVTIFIRAVDKASRVLQGVGRAGSMALKGLAVGMTAATAAVTAFSMAYSGLIKTGVAYNAQMERFHATLETTMKSQERATKTIMWAKKFAAETPFQIPEIIEATVRLETYNLSASKVLKRIGDMAAIMGKPLMMAIEAIADAQTGEMERLKEFGITKRMLIEEGMEVTAGGQVKDFEQLNEALFRIMEERYEGGMQKMMKGFTGVVSNLQDVWGQLTGMLAEPMFEKVKAGLFELLGAIEKFKSTGKLDKLLTSWGKIGVNVFDAIIAAFKQMVPLALTALETVGKSLSEFTESIDPESIVKFTKKIVSLIASIVKVSMQVTRFVIENWKLIASLIAMTVLAKVTSLVMSLTKAIILVIATTAKWIAANTAVIASMGTVGIAAVIIGATAALVIYISRMKTATDKTLAFSRSQAKVLAQNIVEKYEDQATALRMMKIETEKYNRAADNLVKYRIGLLVQLNAGIISQKFYTKETQQATKMALKQYASIRILRQEMEKLEKAIKAAATPYGPPLPPGYEERLKARKKAEKAAKAAAAFAIELEEEYTSMMSSEFENRRIKIEAQYADYTKRAKGNADVLALIARNKAIAIGKIDEEEAELFAKIQEEKAKKAQDAADVIVAGQKRAWTTIMQLVGNEAALREASIQDAYNETLAATQSVGIAEAVANEMRKRFAKDDIKLAKEVAQTKIQLEREINASIFEAEGKNYQAKMIRLAGEIDTLREKGATEVQIGQFVMGRLVQLQTENIEKIEKERDISNKKRITEEEKTAAEILRIEDNLINSINSARQISFEERMIQISEEVIYLQEKGINAVLIEANMQQQIMALKEAETARFLELEGEKLSAMDRQFSNYVGNAMRLIDILTGAQEKGWSIVLAALIRFATKLIANYMRGLAMEKLKQASEASTAAKSARHDAMRLGRLAAYNSALAATALAMGDLVTMSLHLAAAGQAGIAAGVAAAEAISLEAEAALYTSQAAALTIGATAVETAGELAARGIERSAAAATEAAREVEEREREELRLQNEILQAQGRGHEVRMSQIAEEAERMRSIGADLDLVRQWEEVMLQQERSRGQEASIPQIVESTDIIPRDVTPTSVSPIIVTEGTEVGGAQTLIYQTNYFNSLIDISRQEDLSELALLLSPYLDEIEDLSRE